MSKKSEPAEPLRLRENAIVDGVFIRAGEPTPFARVEDLPESLKPLLADGSEEFYHPSERLIYDNPQPGPDPGVVYQPLSGGQWVRRQARQAASISQEQIYAEEQAQADAALPIETQEALEAKHSGHIEKLKAQMQYDRDAMDRLHESLEAEAKPQPFFIKRGSVFQDARKVKPRPSERVFVKRLSGEYEFIGVVDSEGELPPEEIIP